MLLTRRVCIPLDRLCSARVWYVLPSKIDLNHVLPSFLFITYPLLVSSRDRAGVFLCAFLRCLCFLKLTAADRQVAGLFEL